MLKPYFETELGKLYNGDCLEVMDYLIKEGLKVDLICVDPDYITTPRGNAGNSGGMLQKKENLKGNLFVDKRIDILNWVDKFIDILKEDSHFYIMTNDVNLKRYMNILEEKGLNIFKLLVWVKDNKIMGQYYMGQKEYIIFGRKGNAKKINNCGISDVIILPNLKDKDENGINYNDTQKPIELMEILINNSTNENDTVLDFMCGTGSTLLAAERNNRKWLGIDIRENQCKFIKQRFKQGIQQTLI